MRRTRSDILPSRPARLLAGLVVGATLGAALFAGCTELPPIERDVCGNQVIDRELGEECDGFVPPELVTACREVRGAASPELDPCRFECAASDAEGSCQLVADGVTTFCPLGYALGYDGICRRPSGRFAAQPFARTEVVNLEGQIDDLDGDGVNDLLLTLGPDLTHILYFQEGGGVLAEVPIPALTAVAGRISADEASDTAADLLVAQGPAITTFRGAEGPSLLPKAYAPFQNPVAGAALLPYRVAPSAAPLLQVPPGFDVPLLVIAGPGNDLVLQSIDVETFEIGAGTATFPGVADQMVGAPVFVDLLPELTSAGAPVLEPEPEIVVATENEIHVGSLTKPDKIVITPPAGETIRALLPVSGGPMPQVAVLVSGPAGSALRLVLPATGDPMPEPVRLDERTELPAGFASPSGPELLAVGFINADPGLDLVTDGGVLFYLPDIQDGTDTHYEPLFVSGSEPWVKAVIGDVHGDGRNEVIALPRAGDVAVLLPGTAFTMNPALLPLANPADLLELGDFDGDGVGDVLVVTETDETDDCAANDDLYVLFGRTAGVPEDPLLVGSLAGVYGAAPLRLYIDGLADGISDIGVQTRCSPKGEAAQHVGVFLGSTSRIVSSPFSPYVADFGLEPTIERLAIGHLAGPDASAPLDTHLDLAVVGTLEDGAGGWKREVRIVAITGDAEMTDLGEAVEIGKGENASDLLDFLPGIAVGPLFAGSPTDEIVIFSTTRTTGGLTNTLHVVERTGAAPKVQTFALPTPSDSPDPAARVRLFDFDGDGDLDVFAVARSNAGGFLFVNDGVALAETPFIKPPISFDVASIAQATCFEGEPVCDASRSFLIGDVGNVRACPAGSAADCALAIDAGQLVASFFVGDLDADGLEDVVTVQPARTDVFAQCSQSDVAKGACGGTPLPE